MSVLDFLREVCLKDVNLLYFMENNSAERSCLRTLRTLRSLRALRSLAQPCAPCAALRALRTCTNTLEQPYVALQSCLQPRTGLYSLT